MRRQTLYLSFALLLIGAVWLVGCAGKGTIQFDANGEDFVREGFVSKDGWQIDFDHVYITLSDIAGYQTEPAYDPHSGGDIEAKAEAALAGRYTVDLAEGGTDADPIRIGEVTGAPAGHYKCHRLQDDSRG